MNPGLSGVRASYSNLLLELGRLPEALSQAKAAQRIDPLSVTANDNLAGVLLLLPAIRTARLIKAGRRWNSIPRATKPVVILAAYTQKKQYADAITEFKKAIELSHGGSEALAELGYVYGVSGEKNDAERILQELGRPADGRVSHYRLAIVYMGLGENDKALDSLGRAVKERAPGVVHLKVPQRLVSCVPRDVFKSCCRIWVSRVESRRR